MRLEVKNASYTWHFRGGTNAAVQNVTAAFESGVMHAICGPSGSGKSTLAMLMAGLLEPDSGEVTADGSPFSSQRSKLAFVFQFPESIFFEDSVREELVQITGDGTNADRWFCELGISLADVLDKHPFHLSEGYARMVAVALQLSREPTVLILDEPTIGLDWHFHQCMVKALKNWLSPGRILVVVTHDLDLMRDLGGSAWVMSEGGLAWHGSTEELLNDPPRLEQYGLQV
jgi:energy-coupling factor transporter ATP-binding protein EcfA2